MTVTHDHSLDSDLELRTRALESLLIDKGLVTSDVSHRELTGRSTRSGADSPPCAFEGAVGAISSVKPIKRGHVPVR
jgi:hypothetical protein